MRLILASSSPRRKELISHITDKFVIITKDTDESFPTGTAPTDAVQLIAKKKALAVFLDNSEDLVIGADTIVVLEGEIMGKPKNNEDAKKMLHKLSGKTHTVYTGVHIVSKDFERTILSGTEVLFDEMTDIEIDDYVLTGEPLDKAGAYGIQGFGSKFVKEIRGDYFNVMGFPTNIVYNALKSAKNLNL